MSAEEGDLSLDDLLEATEPDGLEQLSLYGLSARLANAHRLLDRTDVIENMKAPGAADQELLERREEVFDVQSRLKRAMGSLLEEPSLTKREQPLAVLFVQEQLTKLRRSGGSDARAAKGIERLEAMLAAAKQAVIAPESRQVRCVEASIKDSQAEWKEISPLYDRWQAGKHNFKSNGDLQVFRRRYEDCRKSRETSGAELEKALCRRRDARDAARAQAEVDDKARLVREGWAGVAKKAIAPAPGAPATRTSAAARAARPPRPAATGSSSAWGLMSLAQRLRAQAGAQVRVEAEEAAVAEAAVAQEDAAEEEEEEEEAEEEAPHPPVPPPPVPAAAKQPPPACVKAKAPPVFPPMAACAPPSTEDAVEDDEFAAPAAPAAKPGRASGPASSATATAAGKKKQKSKKKRGGGGGQDDGDLADGAGVEPPETQSAVSAAWAVKLKETLAGSVVEELLGRGAWGAGASQEDAEARMVDLRERLPLSNPLGLVLPLLWAEFASLQVDGGPPRTSRRGESPASQRLQATLPYLMPSYLTVLFLLLFLHGLTYFDLLAVAVAVQAGLMLVPSEQLSRVLVPASRPLAVQVSHLVVWLSFVRAAWSLNMFVKLLVVGVVCVHSYIVVPVAAPAS